MAETCLGLGARSDWNPSRGGRLGGSPRPGPGACVSQPTLRSPGAAPLASAPGSREGRALPPPVGQCGTGTGAGLHSRVLAHRPQSGRAEREEETRLQPLLLLRPLAAGPGAPQTLSQSHGPCAPGAAGVAAGSASVWGNQFSKQLLSTGNSTRRQQGYEPEGATGLPGPRYWMWNPRRARTRRAARWKGCWLRSSHNGSGDWAPPSRAPDPEISCTWG